MKTAKLSGLVMLGLVSIGCGSPAAPFDTLKTANLTAVRLQNNEPPPPPPVVAGAAAPSPAQGLIPGLPPEIQALAQQGLPALQQLLPPGLLPPGLIPGVAGTAGTPAAAAPPPQQQVARFHNFRILGQTQVMDSELREELGEVFGDEDNFTSKHAGCMYAELGLSFMGPGGQPNDLLISFSCNNVSAQGFMWPHKTTGLKPETVEALAKLVPKIWPG